MHGDGVECERNDERGRDSERGQLLLIGGLGVAVALVALALVLNSAAFTQATATRPGPDGAAAADYGHAVRDGVAGLIAETNYYHNGSNALRAGVRNWSGTVSRRNAVYGTLTNVSVVSTTPGTAIRQPYASGGRARNFTNANGATNWTLFSGANGARSFLINVSGTSALATNSANAFAVIVTASLANGSTRRVRTNVSHTGGTVHIAVNGTSYNASAPTRVDFSNASVGGKHAQALDFFANANVTRVRFENAANVTGRYAIVAANAMVDPGQYNDTVSDPPTEFDAVYDATVRATYEGPRVTTNRTMTVAPGSPQTVVPGGDRFGAV